MQLKTEGRLFTMVASNNICCENFILVGEPDAMLAQAERIVSDAKIQFPGQFEGNLDSFSFNLRYTPPFERNFLELKRLQGTAAEVAGRRDEFKGYIIINPSAYLTHENDDYFEMTLYFLADMSGDWRYIFLIDNTNTKAANELVRHMLSVFARVNLFCEVKEFHPVQSSMNTVNTICKEHGVNCTVPVKGLLQKLLVQEAFKKEVVSVLVWDISRNYGQCINSSTLDRYLSQGIPVIKYMLNEKEYSRFTNIITQEREKRNGEKEAI